MYFHQDPTKISRFFLGRILFSRTYFTQLCTDFHRKDKTMAATMSTTTMSASVVGSSATGWHFPPTGRSISRGTGVHDGTALMLLMRGTRLRETLAQRLEREASELERATVVGDKGWWILHHARVWSNDKRFVREFRGDADKRSVREWWALEQAGAEKKAAEEASVGQKREREITRKDPDQGASKRTCFMLRSRSCEMHDDI